MKESPRPGFWQVTKSVLAAAIGVQSQANRKRDFQSQSIWPFVLGGIVFTFGLVVGLIALVLMLD